MIKAHALVLAGCIAIAACGTDSSAVAGPIPAPIPTPVVTIGKWRMQSLDARPVPGKYAEFFDEPVGDRIVRYTEIRLDSAVKELRADSTYLRRYYYSEFQDGVLAFRYSWSDHGKFSIDGATPRHITLTSEYFQNLSTTGRVSATGAIELSEQVWLGEEPRSTIWAKE